MQFYENRPAHSASWLFWSTTRADPILVAAMERFDVDKEGLYYLFDLFKTGRIRLDPAFQRGRVWSDDLRYLLIESIRNEFPIGLIMFNVWQHADEDGAQTEHFEVVDGQQRIRTIIEFLDGENVWTATANPDKGFLPFKKLSPAQQARFKEYKIPVAKMKEFEAEAITECYNRLQYGRPLKIGEKLKSQTTRFLYPYVKQLTDHKIFTIDPRHQVRDAHWTLATVFFKSMYTHQLFARQEYPQLASFLKSEKKAARANRALDDTKKVLNYEYRVLQEALRIDSDFSKYAQTARTLKWLFAVLATLLKTHGLLGREHKVAEGVLSYYQLISQEGSEEWVSYLNTGRTGRIDTKEVRDALVQLSNQIVLSSGAEPLDKKRFFTPEQRKAIFDKAGGRCQECGVELSRTNFHADHKKPHSASGKTMIDNGRALCTKCNREKGAAWKELFPTDAKL